MGKINTTFGKKQQQSPQRAHGHPRARGHRIDRAQGGAPHGGPGHRVVTEYTTTTHRKVKKRKRDRVYPPLTVQEIKEATLAELDRPLYMPNSDDPVPGEPPPLEVSVAETRIPFMTMRSTRLKYATRTPTDGAPSASWYAGYHAVFPPTEAPIEEMFDDAPPWRSEWYGTLDLKGRPIEYYGHRRPGQNSDAESYDYD